MMLSLLLEGIAKVTKDQDCEITSLTIDSREVVAGTLFIALQGTQQHGLDYAELVLEKSGSAIVWESSSNEGVKDLPIPQIEIKNLRDVLGEIANRFYGSPSKSLNVIGITGTDGKTSVSHFMAQALEQCAVMGTLGIGSLTNLKTATHTTPDVINTHKNILLMKDQGLESVAMEVSSHALDQGRVAGVNFNIAILTNLSRDHLDYHGTVEAYAEAKAKLFAWSGLDALVLNIDDGFGKVLFEKWGGGHSHVIPYGIGQVEHYPENALVAENATFNNAGIRADIHYAKQHEVLTASVLGRFNLSNILAALGGMLALGHSLKASITELSKVVTVSGRMEKVADTKILTVVDYAHTPNALETVLKALQEHTQNKLICVFGCGGDRDAGKRPLMAEIAEANADIVIATDDNPRSENPKLIMQDIVAGFNDATQIIIEHNRAEAIRIALEKANDGDTVLIAGKGHENQQILASGTIAFSDKDHANKVLRGLAA